MKPVLRPCKTCGKATENKNGYCDAHQANYSPPKRLYDDRRKSPSLRGYDATWRKFREVYLSQHPLCAVCEKEGRITAATEIHHIKPLCEGGARLDENNLVALCHSCHSKITAKWRGEE